jgi:hypothetical protein
MEIGTTKGEPPHLGAPDKQARQGDVLEPYILDQHPKDAWPEQLVVVPRRARHHALRIADASHAFLE